MERVRRSVLVAAMGSLVLGAGLAGAQATQAPAAPTPAEKVHYCPKASPCDSTPQTWQINVIRDQDHDKLTCKDTNVSKKAGNTIRWCSTETGWHIRIAFEDATGADPVYPAHNCNGNTYSCVSGALNKKTKNGTHSYHVFLRNATGAEKEITDPGVIVND